MLVERPPSREPSGISQPPVGAAMHCWRQEPHMLIVVKALFGTLNRSLRDTGPKMETHTGESV